MSSMRGRVWISQTMDSDRMPGDFIGYWETDDDEPRILEEGLRWSSLEPALAWGRERAPVVMVRLASTEYYSAGREQPSWRPDAPRWSDAAARETAPGEAADAGTPPGLMAGAAFRAPDVTRF